MQDPATTYVAAMQMQMQMQIEQGVKVAPQFPEQEKLRCPRCDSTNTKFCYYNNYNLSQPRHFCKACRRYWTKGGALRNIPIGGSSRKATKRSSSKLRPANANTGPSGRAAEPKPEPADSFAGLELPMPAGTFTSLLVSDGQLGSLLDAVGPALPRSSASDSGGCWGVAANNTGTGGGGSDGVGGGGAWPDLAIFTRSSGFQL